MILILICLRLWTFLVRLKMIWTHGKLPSFELEFTPRNKLQKEHLEMEKTR